MKKTVHMCLNIEGVLRWPDKELEGWIKDDNGNYLDGHNARLALKLEQARGRRVLPYGECEGFDYQTGCPGHEVKE